jgi:excisionase family DNA binding protein
MRVKKEFIKSLLNNISIDASMECQTIDVITGRFIYCGMSTPPIRDYELVYVSGTPYLIHGDYRYKLTGEVLEYYKKWEGLENMAKQIVENYGGKKYSLNDASEILGIKVRTLRQWVHDGKVNAIKYSRGSRVYITAEELERVRDNGNKD